MKIIYLGGKQAGLIGLLTAMTQGTIIGVVPYSDNLRDLAHKLEIPTYRDLWAVTSTGLYTKADILLSVHAREIIPRQLTDNMPCINIHPGENGPQPIKKAIEKGHHSIQVKAHYMTEEIDEGEIISKYYGDIKGCFNEGEAYNLLYPTYIEVILCALKKAQSYPETRKEYYQRRMKEAK